MIIKLMPLFIVLGLAWWQMRAAERATERELADRRRPLTDPALTEIVTRFRRTLGTDRLRVDLYDVEVINGLATPDGGIYLTRGLVDRCRAGFFSPEEIAGVIAHEIGHLALGHHERRKMAWRAEVATRAALAAFLPRLLKGLSGQASILITRLLHLGLSRRAEFEADAFAAALMRRAGYDPRAQITLLTKLDRLAAGRGQPVSWLASHPPTPRRIAALEGVIDGQVPKG